MPASSASGDAESTSTSAPLENSAGTDCGNATTVTVCVATLLPTRGVRVRRGRAVGRTVAVRRRTLTERVTDIERCSREGYAVPVGVGGRDMDSVRLDRVGWSWRVRVRRSVRVTVAVINLEPPPFVTEGEAVAVRLCETVRTETEVVT